MKADNFNILIVDDEPEHQAVLCSILESEGYRTDRASGVLEALAKIKEKPIDLVLTDLVMGEINGIELLTRIKAEDEEIEVIVITGFGTVANAVEAMKKGAYSYFIKGNSPDELLLEIKKALNLAQLQKDNKVLKSSPAMERYFLQTKSKSYADVLDVAQKAALSNANVLLAGESGVGKEVIAEYIHNLSNRRNGHFFPVNCHALSEGLLEDELFGHEKGAYTGANRLRKGKFEAAHLGTLLLDEIGDIPNGFQAKLLRVIETKKIQRIGDNKSIPVDFRLIATTNNNLVKEVANGRFREDLYYRLCVIHINIPPLRERREDIPMLTDFFLNKFNWEMKRDVKITDDKVWHFLHSHDYPGNIRELKNIIEQLVVLSENGVINDKTLNKTFFPLRTETQSNINPSFENSTMNLKEFRKMTEKRHIRRILELTCGNKDKAAVMLGISVRQLFNKINELNLK